MSTTVKNILAIASGIFIGGAVNMALISVSGKIIAPPAGADVTTSEGLKAAIHLFEPKHFLMPFLAHALGTLVGAAICTYYAANQKLMLAMLIAVWFFIGGFISILMLPSPLWFSICDLTLAYLPMAYLGWKMTDKKEERISTKYR